MQTQLNKSASRSRGIDPFVKLEIKNARYCIKTVDQIYELEKVLSLRQKIFASEYQLADLGMAFDIDRHDFKCDHLIIKENESDQIIGTYRLLCSSFTQDFYSANEFHLDEFLSAPGVKLELGRACIDPEHRKGSVLSLLWRGIVQYALETKADYLFGCSSVKTESYLSSQNINEALRRENKWSLNWNIGPTEPFQFTPEERASTQMESVELPSLLKSYLGAGAQVYGEPAYDREFHCLDYLTILKLAELKSSFEKRYG